MFKFFSYHSLETMFHGEIEIDDNTFYISSISDLLFIAEQYKKNKLRISDSDLISRFELTIQKSKDGLINFVELDRDSLINNLFEESNEGVITLDKKAANSKISPRFSISLICLKINNINCYWEHEVFNEMESIYLEIESYE